MYTTRINLRPYLQEYMLAKYSDDRKQPCKIPPSSDLYLLILDLLARRPASAVRDTGNLEIILPNRAMGKRTSTFNFLSEKSQYEIDRHIYVMFWAEFHRYCEYQIHVKGESLLVAVLLFKSMYDIESLSQDAFIKNYQRWRDRQCQQRRVYRSRQRLI